MSTPDSLTLASDAASARPAARAGILRRVIKGFAWFSGIFTLLIVLFLTIPGIKCDWGFPENGGRPWFYLYRKETSLTDVRAVKLGGFIAGVVFRNAPVPLFTPRPLGAHWENGRFTYTSDHWQFRLQLWDARP